MPNRRLEVDPILLDPESAVPERSDNLSSTLTSAENQEPKTDGHPKPDCGYRFFAVSIGRAHNWPAPSPFLMICNLNRYTHVPRKLLRISLRRIYID